MYKHGYPHRLLPIQSTNNIEHSRMLCSCLHRAPVFLATFHLLIVVNIDDSLGPLASGYFALEQDVNLAIGSVLHLRQVDVCQGKADKTSTGPNVAALAAKICFLYFVSNGLPPGLKGEDLTLGLSI